MSRCSEIDGHWPPPRDLGRSANQSHMPIPDAENAIAGRDKIHGYVLNLDHPDGGSKAIWFHSLGYRRQDWERLADDLLEIARTCDEYETEYSAYGVKYKVSGVVGCPGHRPGRVLTVWIVEPDELPRLVTAYPDDDE